MAQTYNLPDHKKGDTFNGQQFHIQVNGSDYNITSATIVLDTGGQELSTTNNEITITNGVQGRFKINEQIIDWPIGRYKYEIIITTISGRVKTWIEGLWKIIE
jgi:hypothetical protein